MESRKITIVSTTSQSKVVINTGAETLKELKETLDAAGVGYEGMTFYEGLSHTEMLSDDSILPRNIMYKGNPTNELVFMLTVPNKKITSGLDLPEARKALYETIKELALEDEVIKRFGKNFTQCKNYELLEVIENHNGEKKVLTNHCGKEIDIKDMSDVDKLTLVVKTLISCLVLGRVLPEVFADAMMIALGEDIHGCDCEKKDESPYSDEEIAKMFNR